MSPAPLPFQPNAFPLGPGVRLLEASAGTGKTFALAHLVLRLVVEEGIELSRMLVVTFTEAAAAELRDRIGRRLQEALAELERRHPSAAHEGPQGDEEDRVEGGPVDAVLLEWLGAQHQRPTDTVRGRLLLALEDLDAADITTIHGFCRRTLERQALEAGRPPELRLDEQPGTLIAQVVHDYWQQQVLALPVHLVAGLRQRHVTPETLTRLLGTLDGDPALVLDPPPPDLPPDRPLIEALPTLWHGPWSTFQRLWQERGRDLEQDLLALAGRWKQKGLALSDNYYKPTARSSRAEKVERWIAEQPPEGNYGSAVDQELLRKHFHPGTLSAEIRKVEEIEAVGSLPQRPLLEAVADLVDGPAERVLLHACHHGLRELRHRREQGGSVGFSQLLEALDPGEEAPGRGPLLEAVAGRYPVALIDEFQDTDPVQWRILRLAFGDGEHRLVMVGDPKQAIYRFRGGDLDTYREASATAQERYLLEENRRSSPELVQALNALMRPGLRRSELEVPPVRARADRGGPLDPPLELLWLAPEPEGSPLPSRTEQERRVPDRVAAYAAALLERGLLLREGTRERPLDPGDLCLLVHSHRQAEQLRAALERRGLATRLVSREDVFASPAATALQRLLDALADPAAGGRLRLLAASPLMGWGAARIAAADARSWSDLAGRLEHLASQLPHRGLLGVLAELVGSECLASLALGGRLLADLQQTAQLVQERIHADQLGAGAAADWLRRLRHDPERILPEAHQIHSDRADGAIAVVTVHRSKGLEFPVVLCPYLWQKPGGEGRGGGTPGVRWHRPGQLRPCLDLHLRSDWGPGWLAARQHRQAEVAERERVAYVAVTRARHLLVLLWATAKDQQGNPLFPWLFEAAGGEAGNEALALGGDAHWRDLLEEEIRRRRLPLRLLEAPEPTAGAPWRAPAPGGPPLERAPVPQRRLDTRWGRSSYTSWTRSHPAAGAGGAPREEEGRDTRDPETPDGPPDPLGGWAAQGPLGSFPRGATAGDALHRILERIDYRTPLTTPASRAVVEAELRRAGLQQENQEALLEGLERMRLTPFGGALGPLRVADLGADRRLNEMNFDLSLAEVRARALAEAFAAHPGGRFGAAYAERVARLPVESRGFLTGSIDLVFTTSSEDGPPQWWVADWKSNWLGDRDGEGRPQACGPRHYGPQAMAALMAAHHYPLQAHLYLVALHRTLAWRLRDYEPAVHLGGYVYVFLRGTPGPQGERALPGTVPGMLVERPPLGRVLALDGALGRLTDPMGEP